MLLKFTQDATTITLSGDGVYIAGCSYVPQTAKIVDPGDIVGNRDVTVAESAEVVLTGTAAQIVAQARAIETMLGNAAHIGWMASQRVYVNYRAESSGDVYRSEVVGGRVEWPDAALTPRLASGAAAVLVIWERRYWWEDALTVIGLKRTGVSKTTSGVLIYNHHDSTTHENFVDIEGADIAGAIPAPLKLWMEAGGTLDTHRFYLTANVFHSPSNWQAVYEGEDQTSTELTHPAATSDANSSGGYYQRCSWTGSVSHTDKAFIWPISATQLGYAAGGWFRVLMRLANDPPANCYVRLRVMFDSTTPLTTLWEGPEILLGSEEMHDLGSVPLPPGYVTGTSVGLALVLSIRNAATNQLDVDYIQLDGPDGVHRFEQQGYQLVSGDLVVDDGPNEGVYVQTSGGYTQHIFSDYPPPLLVWPGRDMRIRLLHNDAYGNFPIAKTLTMYAFYRPRRLTV